MQREKNERLSKAGAWFLRGLCLLLLAACLGCSQEKKQEDQGRDSDVGIGNLRQLVAADNKTSRTIIFQGDKKRAYSLEWKLEEGGSQQQAAVDSSFQDGKDEHIQYTGKLQGLAPGSRYRYRIVTPEAKGAWHSLRTDDGKKGFTALIFPDSQSSDYSGWQRLAKLAFARNPEAALAINMGDQVDNGEDGRQWQEWFKGVAPFSGQLPLATLDGNHETYTLDWKVRLPKAYLGFFDYPLGLQGYEDQFYSFDYGPVHFTALDTNFKELEQLQPRLWEEELRWLEEDLARSQAKWKVVLMHKDIMIYGFSPESGRPPTKTRIVDIGERLMPIFEKHKVDLVLTAHLHTYRRRVPLKLSGPAPDGIPYVITGVAGSVRYAKLWGDYELDAGRAPQPETCNYLTLQASPDALLLQAFLEDGKEFDRLELKK